MKVTEIVAKLAEPVVKQFGCELWDVEYVREGDQRFLGSNITVKLYRPRNGLKEIPCVLSGYDNGKLTVTAGKETITFEKSEVALVRLRVEF